MQRVVGNLIPRLWFAQSKGSSPLILKKSTAIKWHTNKRELPTVGALVGATYAQ